MLFVGRVLRIVSAVGSRRRVEQVDEKVKLEIRACEARDGLELTVILERGDVAYDVAQLRPVSLFRYRLVDVILYRGDQIRFVRLREVGISQFVALVPLDERRDDLYLGCCRTVARTVHKLDVERFLREQILNIVGIDVVRKLEVRLPFKRADTETVIVEHKVHTAVIGTEAVCVHPVFIRCPIGLCLVRRPEEDVKTAVGERHRFLRILAVFQMQDEVEVGFVVDPFHAGKF